MRKLLLLSAILFSVQTACCQTAQFIGLNLNQLPATSVDLNYQLDILPFVSLSAEAGITFNYRKNVDLIGYLLSRHCDCMDLYDIDRTSGGHLKTGALLNLRRSFEKENYFNLGVYLNQSLVHQEGEINGFHPDYTAIGDNTVNQTLYIIGFSGLVGYNLKLGRRLALNPAFQFSLASDRAWDLYGISDYVPGMGLNELKTRFPMLLINLKYRIR
ncbi:MAG: hypothetical protein U0T82_07740 [Bacteroidales bacterium]